MRPYHRYDSELLGMLGVLPLILSGLLNLSVADEKLPEADLQAARFFKSYCVRCHGAKKSNASVKLDQLHLDQGWQQQQSHLESILDVLADGSMPPEGERQPTTVERKRMLNWMKQRVQRQLAESPSVHVPLARRLTNIEYENTMRDLFGFQLDLIDLLSKDPTKPYRFNNTAELMRLGPEQIKRYLECARKALASAIVEPGVPKVHKTRRQWQSNGVDRGIGGDEVGVYGNRRNTPAWGMGLKSFPKTGEFRIRVKASAILPTGASELPLRIVMGYSLNENSSTLRMRPVGTVRLRNDPDHPQVYEFTGRIENHPVRPPRGYRRRTLPPSLHVTPQNLYDDGTLNDVGPARNITLPRAVIEWMEFEAPLTQVWPPEHHTRILFASPLRKTDLKAYVREVIRRFMVRAYRRPPTTEEVDRFVNVYNLVSGELNTLEAAMRETLAMVLISPQFLYHTVAATNPAANTGTQFELASRLSYFLWASMPDDELFQLAKEGRLADPQTIRQQALRMLADRRATDFVRNFTTQWLSLNKMKTVPINRDLFPRFLYYVARGERAGTEVPYRPTIRDYMIEETVGFVGELIRSNRPVTDVVDSDFAYLNQPLAAHYGITGVEGIHLRPVAIKPEDHLGGLLTQGSMLVGNGTGSAPHPIYRAVWLREAILGDEVPPPPAEVPALSDSAGESAEKALSIKDLLAKHRQNSSCNSCHARLDPWGIPFEHYNAIGKYQPLVPKAGTRVRGFAAKTHGDLTGYQAYLDSINTVTVDARAQVPNGPMVTGMAGLKKHLISERRDAIAYNVVRRLFAYGLGRELHLGDRAAVQQVMAQTKPNRFRWREMIVAVCESELFRSGTATNRRVTISKTDRSKTDKSKTDKAKE